MHPLERCLLHPPLAGITGSQILRLEILEAMRLGDNHSAQLGIVRVSGCASPSPLPDLLVAKFYDPLYCDHEQDDADPFLCIDRDYSHETAAYVALKDLQGSVVPKYYGSYTLELSAHTGGQQRQRHVRLILIEWIQGTSMDRLDSKDFSQSKRQALMKMVVDSESTIYNRGIHHRDIHPRNVIIVNPQGQSRVSIVDFGRFCARGKHKRCAPEVLVPPLLRWHANWNHHFGFSAWIDWGWQL